MEDTLNVYHFIQKLPWPNSYTAKFLLIAFIGLHIPLLTMVGYLLAVSSELNFFVPILIVSLMGTLGGTAFTLWVISKLLKPFLISSEALKDYLETTILPNLPVNYDDEAGSLMMNVNTILQDMNRLINLKNKLMSVLAHDTRTPLNSILAAQNLIELELAEENINHDSIREYCDIINMSAKQQKELVSNILNMAKMNNGKIPVDKEPVNVNAIFDEIYETNKLKIDAKKINFNLHANKLRNQMINVDKPKIKGALNNLVDNAIKYTPKRGNVTLGAELKDQSLELYVKDDGIGIDLEEHPDLFKFGDSSPDSNINDVDEYGIGLWITTTFTELHGGTVEVESQEGEGSRFSLVFDAEELISKNSASSSN